MDKANLQQLGDYVVSLPELSDRVLEVTNKCSGGNFLITFPIYMYEFGYLFPLQGFVNEVFIYHNLSLAQLHPNGWTILFESDKFLRMLDEEPIIRVFK